MFSIEPYRAEYETLDVAEDGTVTSSWHRCRVVGYTTAEDGEPAYVVETTSKGGSALDVATYIHHPLQPQSEAA